MLTYQFEKVWGFAVNVLANCCVYVFLLMDTSEIKRKSQKDAKSPSYMKGVTSSQVRMSHPITRRVSVLVTHYDRMGFLKSVLKDMNVPLVKERMTVDQGLFVRKLVRELFNGTQQPRITVRSGWTTVTSAAAVLAPSVSYFWGGCINQTDWALVFDEVKVLDGHFEVWRATSGIAGFLVLCIDYQSATALASYNDALAYDTHQASFSSTVSEAALVRDHQTLFVRPKGIPDKQWIPTNDNTTVVAYLKGYSSQATTTVVCLNLFFQMTVEFRQVD
jgi:hypothetical protein